MSFKNHEEVAGTKQRQISVPPWAALPKSLQKSRHQSGRAWGGSFLRYKKQGSGVGEGGLGAFVKDQDTR